MRLVLLIIAFYFSLSADALDTKIKSLMDHTFYQTNKNFIQRVFSHKEAFYEQGTLQIQKVINALKENGLLPLKFKKPSSLRVRFEAKTPPLLLLKTIRSVLSSMGYAYFPILEVTHNQDDSSATFALTTEYALDPTLLAKLFAKQGFTLLDLKRNSLKDWNYTFQVNTPKLAHATPIIPVSDGIELKEISGVYWLDMTDSGKLIIAANDKEWQPQVSFFDAMLHMLNYTATDTPTEKISLDITDKVRFVRVSDVNNPLVLKGGIKVWLEPLKR
ncbi:hypothetical protein [Helicobacter suis]|uniref:hypothetical protein n=1 Tax=Helicobacter suis TaxID=104628 RepID=UPI001F08522E|nr:hypothetical protein [Helicobacter suis]